jgi:hypothetical protein
MDDLFKLNFINEIDYFRLFIGLIVIFTCSKIIEFAYKKYIYSNDNKKILGDHMFPFLISMFLIVSVIKTSIALSLGLVGALSIIRFRTAIKEPGQLITLLVLTSLAISVAAEKEILGIIITVVFYIHVYFNKANKIQKEDRILRIAFKEINDFNILKSEGFFRMYKDNNKNSMIEFKSKSQEELNEILKKINKYIEVISYEII